ncbi:hypothetical protein EC973_003248 [Apophysomyces ossiformis]|uniref:Uncharacterized protein n=1 Tax=Apophysomyces ossiformis TaxID=679940 RepID=A0A8H7BZ77_9FUNG|nr:hypothetical protein EC973_003248 [Apophysomyces ossiformis]
MTLFLTNNCDCAVLISIEDGRYFPRREDEEMFVHGTLNLLLPAPVDDLIPPSTRISTQPIACTNTPRWRTTLVYFMSLKILRRLTSGRAEATLTAFSISVDGLQRDIGRIKLRMDKAKFVLMKKGKRNLAQIKDYVVDKGDWYPLGKGRAEMKVGLFIVKISPTSDIQKEMATPLRKPLQTSNDLGFEISSNASGYLSVSTGHGEGQYESEGMPCTPIRNEASRYSFLFRIMEARYLNALLREANNAHVCFQYTLLETQKQAIRCYASENQTTWHVSEQPYNLFVRVDLPDILGWLDRQQVIIVHLLVLQEETEQIIGSARIHLGRWQREIKEHSFPVYDCFNRMSLWQNNIAQITVQMGLIESWET